jgi:transposase-like protein
MARTQQLKNLEKKSRQNRYFSESFRKKKVKEIEQNIATISEISREYQVSKTAIYKWIYKYSHMYKKGQKQVVEAESDTQKIELLKKQVKELEQALGKKQLVIDFQDKVIDLAEEEYDIAIKKKYGARPYSGTGTTEGHTK